MPPAAHQQPQLWTEHVTEPWLDKRELAEHLSCSVRSVQTALAEGMPHAVIFGRVKVRVSEVEAWLEQHGYLEHAGTRRKARA